MALLQQGSVFGVSEDDLALTALHAEMRAPLQGTSSRTVGDGDAQAVPFQQTELVSATRR